MMTSHAEIRLVMDGMRLGRGISNLEAAAFAQQTLGEDGPCQLAKTVHQWQCAAECAYTTFESQHA